jgi:hypothetical protein
VLAAASSVIAASGAVAAYAATESGNGSSESGVYGRVLLGPPCPVALERPTCADRPLRASFAVIRSRDGKRTASVRSGKDGRFRKALEPGAYRLDPRPTGSAVGTPVKVRVPADRYVRVTVRYHPSNR